MYMYIVCIYIHIHTVYINLNISITYSVRKKWAIFNKTPNPAQVTQVGPSSPSGKHDVGIHFSSWNSKGDLNSCLCYL